MATKTKSKAKKTTTKPGPKEERLIITRDPEDALADLLKPKRKPSKKR